MPLISQSNILQALGWAILNSLWQMALLWVIYQLISGFTHSMKPGKKAGLATGFVIAGFGWFIYTFISVLLSSSTSNPISSLAREIINEKEWNSLVQNTLPVASTVYLILLGIPLWQFIRNYRHVQLIRNNGLNKIDAEWRMFVKKFASRMGIRKTVQVWLSELVDSPLTIGYLKPIILLPLAAVNNLSTKQVEAVLLHELSHIRRYDYLFNLIINFIKTILYFNPFVKLFSDIIEKERENSCDEMVMQFQYKPYEYASALLILEKSVIENHTMMMAASGRKTNLLQRIEIILGMEKRKLFSFRRFSSAVAILVSVFVLNAFLFISRQTEGSVFFGLNNSYNPYYYLAGSREEPLEEVKVSTVKETGITTQKQEASKETNLPVQDEITLQTQESVFPEMTAPNVFNVNYTSPVLPVLTEEDEQNVKEVVAATKKVLQEKEWKELEKSYAEVLNSMEKSALRKEYQEELNRVDWNKFENKLRQSYNNLDWEKINTQLQFSLTQIKIDSINQAITIALSDLGKLEVWMKENKTTCIPDTEISLKTIEINRQKAKAHLNKIRKVQQKKIVKL